MTVTALRQRFLISQPFVIMLGIYFIIPLFVPAVEPPGWLMRPDSYLPFLWWMIIPYFFHFLLILGLLFIPDPAELRSTVRGLVWVSLINYIFFIVWPVDVILLDGVDFSLFPLAWMHSLVSLDYLHQNSFPSQHVVVSTLIALRFRDAYPEMSLLWGFLIAGVFFSTFLVKQHYLLDAVAGLALGLAFYRVYFRLPILGVSPPAPGGGSVLGTVSIERRNLP